MLDVAYLDPMSCAEQRYSRPLNPIYALDSWRVPRSGVASGCANVVKLIRRRCIGANALLVRLSHHLIMNAPQIPSRVLEFLAQRIDTVPHLEALLLLWQDPARLWSEDEIAARVYVPIERSRHILQDLQRRQLVVAESDAATYRYSSAWDDSGSLMSEVALEYRRHLVQITTFIHSGASSSVREFARAFDLKKER